MKKNPSKSPLRKADQLSRFNAASYLWTREDIRLFAASTFEDPTNFAHQQDVVGIMAKSLGMQMIVQTTGIAYKDLDDALHSSSDSRKSKSIIEKVIDTYRHE